MLVISAPALACILKIIELGGRYFYVYLWAFMFAFSVVMLTVAPVLIMPLFNKYTPLEVSQETFCRRELLCSAGVTFSRHLSGLQCRIA